MDIESIKSIWESWKEVQEKKLDPVGKEDGDIDNDGDKDSSDKYLANRRKKVSGEIAKGVGKEPANEPGENPPKVSKEKQVKVAYEEKGVNPFTKDNDDKKKSKKKVEDDEEEYEDDMDESVEFNESISDLMEANLPINMLVGPGGVGGGKTYQQAAKEMMKDAWRALTGKQKSVISKVHKLTQSDDELGKLYRDGWKSGGTSMKPGARKAFDARVKELLPNEETRDYVAAWKSVKAKVQSSMKDQNESAEMPEWLQVIGEKLRAMEESDDPVADEKEAYKDDKKETGKRKAVDKEIQKGTGKEPANEPGQNPPKMSKEKQVKLAYEEVEDDFDNEGDEEDAARIKKRAMRNSDVDDNGEPTKEKMKGMRKEDFASEADWRVTSMREALAVMDKKRSGLNQTPQAKNQSKMATSTEPMLDVLTSVGEAEFVLKHKQSNPDYEDMEDNKAALPSGVKSQSPSRRGTDNLNNGDGKAPRSPRK